MFLLAAILCLAAAVLAPVRGGAARGHEMYGGGGYVYGRAQSQGYNMYGQSNEIVDDGDADPGALSAPNEISMVPLRQPASPSPSPSPSASASAPTLVHAGAGGLGGRGAASADAESGARGRGHREGREGRNELHLLQLQARQGTRRFYS